MQQLLAGARSHIASIYQAKHLPAWHSFLAHFKLHLFSADLFSAITNLLLLVSSIIEQKIFDWVLTGRSIVTLRMFALDVREFVNETILIPLKGLAKVIAKGAVIGTSK
jgi:ABC-type protease/lipase transport system fused ATPase/permease subunit